MRGHHVLMSHLTILPTVITDLELLEETLLAEHYLVQRPGLIKAFGQDIYPAELVATDQQRAPNGLEVGCRWIVGVDAGSWSNQRFRGTSNPSQNDFAGLCPEVSPPLQRWSHLWSLRLNDRPAGS